MMKKTEKMNINGKIPRKYFGLMKIFLTRNYLIRFLIVEEFLKYIIWLVYITFFLTGGTRISFADTIRNDSKNVSFQRGKDANDGEGDDESHTAGRNCLTSGCHLGDGENHFSIGGTIYTDAEGTNVRTKAIIKVIDGDGITTILRSDE